MSEYYSIRMRASRSVQSTDPTSPGLIQEHISGAERIIGNDDIEDVSTQFIRRARYHEKGVPDIINIKIQQIDPDTFLYLPSLPVYSVQAPDNATGWKIARAVLFRAGVSPEAIERSRSFLDSGYQNNRGLSGALVMDGGTSRILNPDQKGVRVTTMDYTDEARNRVDSELQSHNLSGSRLKEALVLATKVAFAPYAWAEICLSDNPAYHVGYVAVAGTGYFRIPFLKIPQSVGGRVFLVHGTGFCWDGYYRYLREIPVLINRISPFFPDFTTRDILSGAYLTILRSDAFE